MREPSRRKITQLVDEGIIKAQRDSKKGSMRPLCWGPEYFITVNICQSILRYVELKYDEADCLTLEERPRGLKRKHRQGRPRRNARLDGRCDLALWYLCTDNESARAFIEVKKNAGDILGELDRVIDLLKGKEHLEFAILASCSFEEIKNNDEKEARVNLSNAVKDISSKIQQGINNQNINATLQPNNVEKISYKNYDKPNKDGEYEDMHWVWRPVCFLID